jgi:hypothetical protein
LFSAPEVRTFLGDLVISADYHENSTSTSGSAVGRQGKSTAKRPRPKASHGPVRAGSFFRKILHGEAEEPRRSTKDVDTSGDHTPRGRRVCPVDVAAGSFPVLRPIDSIFVDLRGLRVLRAKSVGKSLHRPGRTRPTERSGSAGSPPTQDHFLQSRSRRSRLVSPAQKAVASRARQSAQAFRRIRKNVGISPSAVMAAMIHQPRWNASTRAAGDAGEATMVTKIATPTASAA